MMIYQRYPLHMRHPAYRPAVISDDYAGGKVGHAPPGKPDAFPPVTVNNADQEEYYRSRGYEAPDDGQAGRVVTARVAPKPHNWQPQDYPRWENGRIVQDPNAEFDDKTFPMWVTPPGKAACIVQTAIEYEAVMGRVYEPGAERKVAEAPKSVDADELAEFRRWKAAQGNAKPPTPEPARASPKMDDERAELLLMAAELGLEIDRRWGTKRLREAVERATAPEAATG